MSGRQTFNTWAPGADEMSRTTTVIVAVMTAVIVPSIVTHAQSTTRGSSTRGAGSSLRSGGSGAQSPGGAASQPVDNTFEGRFWRYLTNSPFRYNEWAPFAGRLDSTYKGQSPHGAYDHPPDFDPVRVRESGLSSSTVSGSRSRMNTVDRVGGGGLVV